MMTGRKLIRVVLVVLAAVVLLPRGTSAQATVNPTQALFEPSPDHNATDTSGTPLVQSYDLQFFLVGATAPFQTVSLGKPAPVAGTITVNLTSILVGWPVPGTNYFAKVVAVGPGGPSSGAQSNNFSFTAAPCTYGISPTTQSIAAAGSSATTAVTTTSGCTWTATSNASWISITSGSSGTGNGTTAYTVAANTVTTPRTGTLTVAGKTLTVNQSAAPCTFSISPTAQSIAAAGSSSTTAVTTSGGCTWTATSNASWITIASGSSGTGNGSVDYSVAANTVTIPRSGTVTVAGQTLTVNQQAAACAYNVSPNSQTLAASGGASTTAVTTSSNCTWTVTSNATWITVTSGASGTGNGPVGFNVAANTVTTPRTGTLTVAGQTFTVNQSAAACNYGISPASLSAAAAGGSSTTAVTTSSNCTWTATSNASWITVTSGSSGTGNGTTGFTVAANTVTSPRAGTLTVAGQTFTVNQSAAPCTFLLSSTSQSVAAAGQLGTVGVTTTSGCSWSASSNASWITITGGSSGTDSGTVSYSVAANTAGIPRTGTLTVAGQTFTVNQSAAACTFSLSPTSQNVPASGSSASTTGVTATTGCSWTASSNAGWITVTGGGSGTGNGTVTYDVAANTVTTPRVGTLTVAGQSLTVNQSAAACNYSLSPTSANVVAAGVSSSTAVTTTSGCAWTATSNTSWITVTSGSSGTGSGAVGFTVSANSSISLRSGSLTVAGQTFAVTQDGVLCSYTASPMSQSVAAAGSSATTAVTTNSSGCAWTASSNAGWITITSGSSGTGAGTVAYTVAANTVTSPRSGTLTVAGQTVTIDQSAAACTYSISPTSQSVAAAGSSSSTAVTTTSGCTWTATSNASWITLSGGGSGTGAGTVSYDVAANTVTSPRSGTLTVAGQTLTVNQSAAAACSYSISPASASNVAAAGSPSSTTVTTSSGCAWAATSNASWITITSGSSGTGSGAVTFNIAANTLTSPRSGTLTVAGQTFTVTQDAAIVICSFAVSPMSQSVAAAGNSSTTAVTTTSGCAWVAASNAGWITITSGSNGTGNGTVAYTVGANTATSPRSGTLTVAGQTVTVNQTAAACSFGVSPTSETAGVSGGPETVAVTTTSGCAWNATSNSAWLTLTSGSSGNGNGTVGYTVRANTVAGTRSATLTVAAQTVTVTQSGNCNFTLSSSSVSVAAAGATRTTSVATSAGCSWTAVSNVSWITVTGGSSGTNNGTVTFVIAANTGAPRTGTLTIAGQTYTVTEAGTAVVLSAPAGVRIGP
ncbi:MAG: hypothetical protein ND807_02895 [Vicinamibacterales bacterium]|nr:hypothetical protein [Vicinamibacterales bacterium]